MKKESSDFIHGHLRFDPRESAFTKGGEKMDRLINAKCKMQNAKLAMKNLKMRGGEKEMKKKEKVRSVRELGKLGELGELAVICVSLLCLTFSLSHFLTFPAYAAGLEISVAGGDWELGNVLPGQVESTTGRWTVHASSDGWEDIHVQVSDAGGFTASDTGVSGTNIFGLKETHENKVIKSSEPVMWKYDATAGDHPFDLWFKAPALSSDMGAHTLTVTLTASDWGAEPPWYDIYGPAGTGDVVRIGNMYVASKVAGPGCAGGVAKRWSDALGTALGLVWLGKDDWYLPSRDELSTICSNKSLLGNQMDRHWSSTECPNGAWYCRFTHCGTYCHGKGNLRHMRAVRPSQ